MKKTILTALVASATLFSTASIASTSWGDYLAELEVQLNNYDATVFANIKADASLDALEDAIAKTLLEMKTYAATTTSSTTPTVVATQITDFAGYLKSLDAELSSVVVPSSLKADPAFAKMEAELIALMAQLHKAK